MFSTNLASETEVPRLRLPKLGCSSDLPACLTEAYEVFLSHDAVRFFPES